MGIERSEMEIEFLVTPRPDGTVLMDDGTSVKYIPGMTILDNGVPAGKVLRVRPETDGQLRVTALMFGQIINGAQLN